MQRAIHNIVHLATASLTVVSIGHLAWARVTGVATPIVMARIIREHLQWLPQPQLVNVVDCSACTMAIDLPALLDAGRQVGTMSGPHVTPTAIVSSPDDLPMFRAYCSTAMQHGILKAAFASFAPALAWAQAEAEVRARWQSQRSAR